MNKSEELDFLELVVRYQDHSLDEVGVARLESKLQSNERAREIFHDTVLHALKVYELDKGGYGDFTCATPVSGGHTTGKIIGFPLQAWATAAAVVLLAGLVFLWNSTRSPSIQPLESVRVAEFSGQVLYTAPGELQRPLTAGLNLPVGTKISAGASDSRAALFYTDGTRLLLGPESTVILNQDSGKQVRLNKGVLTSRIAPQPDGRPMQFQIGDVSIEVLGTSVTLARTDASSPILVHEGRVRVTNSLEGISQEVFAGQQIKDLSGGELLVENIPASPKEYVQDFSSYPAEWNDGWHESSATLHLIPQDYNLPEANGNPVNKPIVLVMENGMKLRHEFLREEPAGFYVRDALSGRSIFLPKSRIDQHSIYGEWTDRNGLFSESKFAARKQDSEAFLDLDSDGLDDRRQTGPGESSFVQDSSGIVRDAKGTGFVFTDAGWHIWDESYSAEVMDARIHGRDGWSNIEAGSKIQFRCYSELGGLLRLEAKIIDMEKLEIHLVEREFSLTNNTAWQSLVSDFGQHKGKLIALRLFTSQSGCIIDDVQIGTSL